MFREHIGYAFGVEQAKQKIADEAKGLTLQQDFDPSLGMTAVSGFQNLLQNDTDDPIDHEGRSHQNGQYENSRQEIDQGFVPAVLNQVIGSIMNPIEQKAQHALSYFGV